MISGNKGYLLKPISGNCLIAHLPKAAVTIEANKKFIKKNLNEDVGNNTPTGCFAKL